MSNTLIAVCVAVLFGLNIPILDQIAPVPAPLNLNSSAAAFLCVLMVVWLIRVLQLWPYWRFRESVSSPAPVPFLTPLTSASLLRKL